MNMTEAIMYRHKRIPAKRATVPAADPGAKPGTFPSMSVKVENFGPIAAGKVDIRPLTVFSGPSNTGKSWLASLIYTLGSRPGAGPRSRLVSARVDRNRASRGRSPDEDSLHFPDNPEKWLQAIQNGSKMRLTENDLGVLKSVITSSASELETEMCRCYGVSGISQLIRKGGGAPRAAKILASYGGMVHDIAISSRRKTLSLEVSSLQKPTICFSDSNYNRNFNRIQSTASSLLQFIEAENKEDFLRPSIRADRIVLNFLHLLYDKQGINKMYFLPADRGGIMHTHVAVVNALIGGAARDGIGQGRHLPTLSGVLSDFLERLVEMAGIQNLRGDGKEGLAKGLNDNILCGNVDVVVSDIGYLSFVYRPHGWSESLQMTNASSMVSEVGPVSLFMRYYVRPGDLLILEEPEAHLHPALQRLFIQEVVKWVKQGVRVILTTHSEWVLEELSNIVARSKNLTIPAWRSGQQVLASDDVGVWKFDLAKTGKQGSGTKISEVKYSEDEGGYEAGFYDVMIVQHNEWSEATDDS